MQHAPLSRRGVMALFSWTGTSALLGCSIDGGSGDTPGRSVLVLGAGLAGLSAAYELKKQGYEVTLLEGRERVGGRVWTVREGFADGHVAEIGAVRIPDVHEHTLGYVEELGLETTPFPDGDALYYIGGMRFMHTEGEPWPLPGLNATEASAGLGDLWSEYIASAFDEFGDPRAGTFPKAGIVEKYDGQVYIDFLRERGASEAFLPLYTSDNGAEVYTIGTLAWMVAEVADKDWGETFHIRGGNDQLPQRLAEEVGADNILLAHRVVRIEHTETGVTVTAEHEGEELRFEAAHLVCTLPFTTLRDVAISPEFAADKMDTIRGLYLMNAARGYIQTSSRFWEAEGIGGLKIAKTDTPVERLWDLSHVQEGSSEKGLIVSYTQDKNADAYCDIDPADREAYTLDHIEAFYPEIKAETLAFFHYCWKDDPWVKGAWTDTLPGQWWMTAVAKRPEGRVHFAGEHTSVWAGWMQGAIESGKRAAQEIADFTA
jgi:monoamine oxidase